MTDYNPAALLSKKPNYQGDSFASWLQKTLVTTIELGDLNNLNPLLLDKLKAAAVAYDDVEKINVVDALNETVNETRRVLIRAIAMS